MTTFLTKVKRYSLQGVSFASCFIVMFALVFSPLATPKPTPVAEAIFGIGRIVLDPSNLAQNTTSALENRAQTVLQGQISLATVNSFLKDNVLDGIAWTLAKSVLSSMVRSLINWVNSGFEGSPAFITDIRQHLIGVIDTAAGEFISSLGAAGEFVCSPFRLDVRVALEVNYAQARSGMPSGPDQNLCRLSDIGSNIENFFDSNANTWNDWFQVTANPQNTPLGAYFAAEASLNARLINEAGQSITEANWGSGMLSLKTCEQAEGREGRGNCTITTPGRVISESLTFMTTSGPRSLIEADEINELIGALLNQLVTQVVEGAGGLLGLGGNTAFANYDTGGRTFLDQLGAEAVAVNSELLSGQIARSIQLEQAYLALIDGTISQGQIQLVTMETDAARDAATATSTDGGSVPVVLPRRDTNEFTPQEIRAIIDEARVRRSQVVATLATLTSLQGRIGTSNNNPRAVEDQRGVFRLDQPTTIPAPTTTISDPVIQERIDALTEYNDLIRRNALTTESQIEASYTRWSRVINNLTRPRI